MSDSPTDSAANDTSTVSIPHNRTRPPSYIEKVEDAIVEVLKAGVEGSVKVQAYPANVDSFDFAGLKAAALVHYSASQFAATGGKLHSGQDRRINFSIILLARELRGQGAAYHALEDIRLALQGQVFEGAGPAEIVRDQLVTEKIGVWRWEIVIGLNAQAVPRPNHRGSAPAGLMRPITPSNP